MPNYQNQQRQRRQGCNSNGGRRAAMQNSNRDARRNPCDREETSANTDRRDSLSELPIAMAYVPWQEWRDIYNPDRALSRGTIFEELDLPFRGAGGGC